ncbi:MAG: CaiB/BaiF CoA transferase family protein [Acidimicrobiales bacterium]
MTAEPDLAASRDRGPGPLDGARVLDLTSVVMGPYATQILADLGAEVITVESAKGDTNRAMGAGPHRQLSGVSLNLLRNKRNIAVDLKAGAGREVVLRVAATCDVWVTNLRPGALKRAGLTYDDVRAVRPEVVYCQAQGYPADGPDADLPAYDDIIQAAGGLADAARIQTGRPALAPTILADKVCGLTIAYAVIAAMYRRALTGNGDHIEVPMAETFAAFMLVEHGAQAIPVPPLGPAGYPRILTPNRRPQATTDGWLNVLPYSREHYEALFTEGGRADLVGDPRSATGRARIEHSGYLYQEVAAILATRTSAEWMAFCRERGIPATEVVSLDELVAELPEAEHPVVGRYKVIPAPVRFASLVGDGRHGAPRVRDASSVRRHAPLIGQHTAEVLREVGYDDEAIEALEAAGVLTGAPADPG